MSCWTLSARAVHLLDCELHLPCRWVSIYVYFVGSQPAAGCIQPGLVGDWRRQTQRGFATADLPWLNAVESASGHSCSYTDSRIGPIVGGDIIRPTADGWRGALCTFSGDLTNCFSVQAPTEGSRGVAARTAMTVAVQVKRRRRRNAPIEPAPRL